VQRPTARAGLTDPGVHLSRGDSGFPGVNGRLGFAVLFLPYSVTMLIKRCALYCKGHRFGLPGVRFMVSVYQFHPYFMRSFRLPGDVDRIDVTGVRPPPATIVDVYVQMPCPRRGSGGSLSKDGNDVYVLHPPLDPDDALRQDLILAG
jgi:hypothetical protein